jgi:hypothetical protein
MSGTWPARLGGYDVVRPLSVGGMGAVLLAHKKAHGFEKRVAIKVVLPHLLGDADAQALFADEAKLAARFAHPNLVPTFDFGKDEGLFYLVMELVEGPSFLDVVRAKDGPLHPDFAASLVANAARGLAWAHALCDDDGVPLRVVHRDISHDNLHLSVAGVVKVLDFGIANSRNRSQNTTVGVVRGKPGYMSPERVRGEPVDDRADTWSLGVVAYELLAGERLFGGKGERLIDSVLKTTIHPLEDAPAALSTMVEKMLSRDLSRRPRMAEVVAGFDAYLLEAGVPQTPASLLALADADVPGIMRLRRAVGVAVADSGPAEGRPDDVATADVAVSAAVPAAVAAVAAVRDADDVRRTVPLTARVAARGDQAQRPITDRTHTLTVSQPGHRRWVPAAVAAAAVLVVGAGVAVGSGMHRSAAIDASVDDNSIDNSIDNSVDDAAVPVAALVDGGSADGGVDVGANDTDVDGAVEAHVDVDATIDAGTEAASQRSTATVEPRRRRRQRTPTVSSTATVEADVAPAGLIIPDRTPYVDVFLDGKRLGVSPLGSARRPFKIAPGRHQLRLVEAGSGAVVVDRVIDVDAGATITVRK